GEGGICGSGFEEGGRPLRIRFPVGRQLDEDWSQKLLQTIGTLEKFADGGSGVFKPHDVRAVAAELEPVTKFFGGLASPDIEGRGFRKMIKGIVYLNRVELPRVV